MLLYVFCLESASVRANQFSSLFFRLWYELYWWANFVETAYCVPNDLRHCMSVTGASPVYFQVLLTSQFVILLVFGLPETPRYLYKSGRNSEALQVLCDVYDREPDHPKITAEQGEILDALRLETEHGAYSWRKLFHKDAVSTGQRVLLAYGMQFMNQVGGINLVV